EKASPRTCPLGRPNATAFAVFHRTPITSFHSAFNVRDGEVFPTYTAVYEPGRDRLCKTDIIYPDADSQNVNPSTTHSAPYLLYLRRHRTIGAIVACCEGFASYSAITVQEALVNSSSRGSERKECH